MAQPKIDFYDPGRRPFEVVGRHGPILSTAHTDVFVIAAQGLDWYGHGELLLDCLESGAFGFVAVAPWVPGAKALENALQELVDISVIDDGFRLAHFQSSRSKFDALLTLWKKHGGWASGEWCLGVSHEPIVTAVGQRFEELGGFPDGLLLANLGSIGSGLALAEHQQSLFALRASDSNDRRISELQTSLSSS